MADSKCNDYTFKFDCPCCHQPAIVTVSISGGNKGMYMRAQHIRAEDLNTGYPRHRCILTK